jgi:hypothetical protein
MSSVILEQTIIRAVVSLCSFAAHTDVDDVRDDVRDSAATLIRLCMDGARNEEDIRQWCTHTLGLLDMCASDASLSVRAHASAHVAVLRVQALIGSAEEAQPTPKAQPKAPRAARSLNANQKKLLACIQEHPDIRTKDLVERFSQQLSDRSVKRVLKELLEAGALERTQNEGAVLYRVLDRAE